jgi:hypothetical protein
MKNQNFRHFWLRQAISFEKMSGHIDTKEAVSKKSLLSSLKFWLKVGCRSGLPDGIFSKILIWADFGGTCIKWKTLVYFKVIWSTMFAAFWYILWLFGIFFPFWYVVPRKIWQPCCSYVQHLRRLNLRP